MFILSLRRPLNPVLGEYVQPWRCFIRPSPLHHAGFSMATGLTRTVVDSLNYLSSRSPTIHPSLPTSSRTSLKGCVSWATMRKRPVSAVRISATSLRSACLSSISQRAQSLSSKSGMRYSPFPFPLELKRNISSPSPACA